MMAQRSLVSCTAAALALFLVLPPAVPQAQGRGGPPAQTGPQGGLTALQAQVQALEAAVKQLRADLASEAAARMAADSALQNNVNAEAAARAAADTTLQNAVANEAAARTATDTTLQNDIANEAAARAAADTTLHDALQARITTLSDQVAALQQLFQGLNPAVNTAQQNIVDLRTDLDVLEGTVAMLGGGLTSYDDLAGLPCTSAAGKESFIALIGPYRSPFCGEASAGGRILDFGPVVLDTSTNLMWEKKTTAVGSGANANDLHDVDNTYNWCQATGNNNCAGNATSWIGQVNAEVFAGFSNWRVPTRDELLTIVDMNAGPPRIDPIFGPTQAALYWSATEGAIFLALVVRFDSGLAGAVNKINGLHVRAVRAGP